MTKHIHEKMILYQAGSVVSGIPMLSETEKIECGTIEDGVCDGCGEEVEAPDWAEASITQEIDSRIRARWILEGPLWFSILEEAKEAWEEYENDSE